MGVRLVVVPLVAAAALVGGAAHAEKPGGGTYTPAYDSAFFSSSASHDGGTGCLPGATCTGTRGPVDVTTGTGTGTAAIDRDAPAATGARERSTASWTFGESLRLNKPARRVTATFRWTGLRGTSTASADRGVASAYTGVFGGIFHTGCDDTDCPFYKGTSFAITSAASEAYGAPSTAVLSPTVISGDTTTQTVVLEAAPGALLPRGTIAVRGYVYQYTSLSPVCYDTAPEVLEVERQLPPVPQRPGLPTRTCSPAGAVGEATATGTGTLSSITVTVE